MFMCIINNVNILCKNEKPGKKISDLINQNDEIYNHREIYINFVNVFLEILRIFCISLGCKEIIVCAVYKIN